MHVTHGRARAIPFLLAWLALSALALVHGLGLRSDSYEHFASSARLVARLDWRLFLVDIWNKPLPALLYGVSGQLGLFAARMVSVTLSVGVAACTWDIARRLWPEGSRIQPAAVLVAVLFQVAVLPESFITMTELPAAFALALGLCLYLRGRTRWAFLIWGLLPLLRVEAALLTATLFIVAAFRTLADSGTGATALRRVGPWALLAAAPLATWWILGALASGDVIWLGHGSYAHIRPWSAKAWLDVNVLGGLAGALSIPMLFLGLVGFIRWRSVVGSDRGDVTTMIWACLVVHLLFMNIALVYPAETVGGLGVAAINARNFNVIAPFMALMILAGVDDWWRWVRSATADPTPVPAFLSAAVIAVVACVGFWTLQSAIGGSGFANVYRLRAGLILIAVFWLGSWWLRCVSSAERRRGPAVVYGFLALATLITVPAFWYPLRSQDARAISGREFCRWYGTVANPPRRLVQDFIGSLDEFCGFHGTNADWTWPTDFMREFEAAPDAWILITVNASGEPAPAIYPSAVLHALPTLRLIASRPAPPVSEWQALLNGFGWQNHPVGWRVYARP